MLLLGAHMSISGGLHLAFSRAQKVGCQAMQIFTKNASQWSGRTISDAEAAAFRKAWRESAIGPVLAHDSYLINLGAADPLLWEKSIAAFLDEMQRCARLGIGDLVMHPGAHVGSGEAAGLERIAEALRRIFVEAPAEVTVLLENTAGQGSYLGGRFEHLAAIMERVPQGRFGICFDTCHAFAAGYDLSTVEGYQRVMEEFEARVGCAQIRAFHLNDSKKGLGSRTDRHDHIGQGALGAEAFRALLRDARFAAVPMILETPKGDEGEEDRLNLQTLRDLAAGS
jgi:deoxyribonuclease IV